MKANETKNSSKQSNRVSLAAVRKSMKETTGTPSYCVKQLCIIAETCAELRAILPPKKEALTHVKAICDFGKVGSKKTWSGTVKGCVTVKEYAVKCSVDMCLRYFVKLANGEL